MDPSILACPRCRGTVEAVFSGFSCRKCGAEYPVRHGVPVLIPGMTVEPSRFKVSDELISRMCSTNGIDDEPANCKALSEIFAWNYRLADIWLTAENNYFLQRIGLNADGYRPKPPRAIGRSINEDIRYAIPSHRIPASLPPGQTRSWNVRLVNVGKSVLSPTGRHPVSLTYRWKDSGGRPAAAEVVRTALPIDMVPDRGVTIPLWLATPTQPGRYALEVLLAQGDRIRYAEGACRIDITVSARWQSAVPQHWLTLNRPPETYDYAKDHEVGRVFLKEELARSNRPIQRVLEVGGCCNPMTWDLPAEVVSTDIDVQTLQVGALRLGSSRPNVHFVAADAAVQPFADGAFDCAVLFATLHHFVDPVACLREMARVVRPGGFLAVFCEPIGSYRAETLSAQFRGELMEGINEQIFTDEEYARMFADAGLVASRAVIDGGSFKAILNKVEEGSHGPLVTAEEYASMCHAVGVVAPLTTIDRESIAGSRRYGAFHWIVTAALGRVGLRSFAGKVKRRLKRLLRRA